MSDLSWLQRALRWKSGEILALMLELGSSQWTQGLLELPVSVSEMPTRPSPDDISHCFQLSVIDFLVNNQISLHIMSFHSAFSVFFLLLALCLFLIFGLGQSSEQGLSIQGASLGTQAQVCVYKSYLPLIRSYLSVA